MQNLIKAAVVSEGRSKVSRGFGRRFASLFTSLLDLQSDVPQLTLWLTGIFGRNDFLQSRAELFILAALNKCM